MANVIDQDRLIRKLRALKTRTAQRKTSDYRRGQIDGIEFCIEEAENQQPMEVVAVTRCRVCRFATERTTTLPYCMVHNRRKNPDDFCNFGDPDE